MAAGTHFHSQQVSETTLVFLLADKKGACLILPSLFSLLKVAQIQPENTILYPQPQRSDVKKPTKGQHQHQSLIPPAFISLSQSHMI